MEPTSVRPGASVPGPQGGSVEAERALRGPADVPGAGRDVAHRGAADARRVGHWTGDHVRRNRPPARVRAADTARRCARTSYAPPGAAHADSRGSDGTRNSMTETLTAARHDNADGIARRAALCAGELERRDGADIS